MPDPSSTDPIAILQSLIAAWNRGTAGEGERTDVKTTPHLASQASDVSARLARIEERLALLEALALAQADRHRSGKGKKAKRA